MPPHRDSLSCRRAMAGLALGVLPGGAAGFAAGRALFLHAQLVRGQADAVGTARQARWADYVHLLRTRSYVLDTLGMTAMTSRRALAAHEQADEVVARDPLDAAMPDPRDAAVGEHHLQRRAASPASRRTSRSTARPRSSRRCHRSCTSLAGRVRGVPQPVATGRLAQDLVDHARLDARPRRPHGWISKISFIRSSERTTHPSTALAPPDSPEPAPRGTTGTPCAEAALRTAETSTVDLASTTASGLPAVNPGAWSLRYDASRSGSRTTSSPARAPRRSSRTPTISSPRRCRSPAPRATAAAPAPS